MNASLDSVCGNDKAPMGIENPKPKISVIIPTYNRREYVQQAIDSVLAQSYREYEIIVVDDGSSDDTGEALRSRFGDRVRYRWQENRGESAARNRGIEMAQGEYIALLDSDDLWLPEKLATQVPVLDAEPSVHLVFSQTEAIDATGQPTGRILSQQVRDEDLTLEALCLNNPLGGAPSTAIIRREALQRVGGYDESIRHGEDYDLWLRLRPQGSFVHLPQPLALQRLHRGSQYFGLEPETLAQRLSSLKRSLERVFNQWNGEVPDGLEERALANLYAETAFRYFSAGCFRIGQQHLSRAAVLFPDRWANPDLVVEQLTNDIRGAATINGEEPSRTSHKVRQTLAHLPTVLQFSRHQRNSLISRTCAALAFAAYAQGDLVQTRHCLTRAIYHDPKWLRNIGVWSIGIEVFLGKRLASGLRRTAGAWLRRFRSPESEILG